MYALLTCMVLGFPSLLFGQQKDTSVVLGKVTVIKSLKANPYKNTIPSQTLDSAALQQINAPSIGDAARYFSGVLIKDYGGIGGLKTISVRSLGSTSTGILYDGIPVSNAQSGQIDLSRFSSSFVTSLQLYHAQPPMILIPARAFASSSILSVNTSTFEVPHLSHAKWQAGMKAGSFNYFQPGGAVLFPVGKKAMISANAEGIFSKGDYPFTINNGDFTEKTKRKNSRVASFQGAIDLTKEFRDSSTWQTKLLAYHSHRGLPGAIIFFNNRSVQQLWNKDISLQTRYKKDFNTSNNFLLSAKYAHNYTRYTDPDFLNNSGGLDDRYTQQEFYGSLAFSHSFHSNFLLALASDASVATLSANKQNFSSPRRTTLWNSLSAKYSSGLFQMNGTLLDTYVHDRVQSGAASKEKNKITPMIAMSVKGGNTSPLLFRIFYKENFRMPTFNDLYYNFIGNINLRPEQSRQYNFGVSYSKFFDGTIRGINASVDGYFNQIKDKIIAVPNQNLFTWSMLNVGKVNITGIDINAEVFGKFSTDAGWFTRIAYTFQNAIDVTNPTSENYKDRIPYTPDHSGSAVMNVHYRTWSAGFNMLFSGNRFSQGGNNTANQLQGWITEDLSVSKTLDAKHFKTIVRAEVNNITNKQYDVIRYYPMPGRSFIISLQFLNQ